jgi:hypothetical protein
MKSIALILLGFAGCIFGQMQISNYKWVPDDMPRWNPFAIKESGIGRTLSRVLSEQANTAFHHGLFVQGPLRVANPLSSWLDSGVASLGFPGRLKYRPIDRFPLKPFEVKQALDQVENKLRLAFELDPGNYIAYDVYQFFLTTAVRQTEFGTTTDQQSANTGGDALKMFGKWEGKELERRHQRAIEITETAIRKFRQSQDPERYLTGAVMWYNRFMLLAPDVAARRASVEARKQFESLGFETLQKMQFYLNGAKQCQAKLTAKGLWQIRPEPRREDYETTFQFVNAVARGLSQALENNRSHMPDSYLGTVR